MITKIYELLTYFASVSLLIMRSQRSLIAWTVTSTAAFCDCWSHTEHSVLWIGSPAALRCESFSKKISKKKHLCHHDESYCYFWKSNIPVIHLIVGSRNMIKLSKNMSTARVVFTKYRQYLSVFYCFWMEQNFGKCNG